MALTLGALNFPDTVAIANEEPSGILAQAPTVVYDPDSRSVTWNTPVSDQPITGYSVTAQGLREGDGVDLSVLDDRVYDLSYFASRPTLVTVRATTAEGTGAPGIVAVNPVGSPPAPTIEVSNIVSESFDLTVTAPNGWSGGRWSVRVLEADGDRQFEVLGFDDGPAPNTVTVAVDGLTADTAYRIVAAVDVEGETFEEYQLSSWAVIDTRTAEAAAPVPFAASPVPTVDVPAELLLGAELVTVVGEWSPAPTSFAYQWLRDGVAIDGATGDSYVLSLEDQFSDISVRVTASRSGYVTTQRLSSAVAVGEFPAVSEPVTGSVVNADGDALAGMTVRLHDAAQSEWVSALDSLVTEFDGSFVFDAVEPGRYLLEVVDPNQAYASVWSGGAYWRDLAEPVVVGYGIAGVSDLVMPVRATLSGSVAFDGVPQAYHQLRLERAEDGVLVQSVNASWDGNTKTFMFSPLPPGEYLVAAQSYFSWSDPQEPAFMGEWWQNVSSRDTATPVMLGVGQAVSSIDFDLQLAPRLQGTVLDGEGNPVEGVQVQLLDPAGTDWTNDTWNELGDRRYAMTGADGSWELSGAPVGDWIVQLTPPGFNPWGSSQPVLQRAWLGGGSSPAEAAPIVLEPGEVLTGLDAVLADRDSSIPPALAPSLVFDDESRVLTWGVPVSASPVLGYVVSFGTFREGDGVEMSALDERRVKVDGWGGRPILITVRAVSAHGLGAPGILVLNPDGSSASPTVQVSNIASESFDLTVTAPNGWSGGQWGVTVFEADGDRQFEVLGFDDGPAPTTVTVPVDGLKPDTAYRIVAAVDVEGETVEEYQISSWAVVNTRTLGDPAPESPAEVASPVYRFWSDTYQSHFYTRSLAERDFVHQSYPKSVWRYEGPVFGAYGTQVPGAIPVFRFWSDAYNAHFYTSSVAERDHVMSNYPVDVWKYESIAFYAFPLGTDEPGTELMARFWSPTYQNHFFTASPGEASFVRANYPAQIWTYEGTPFRVPTSHSAAPPLP